MGIELLPGVKPFKPVERFPADIPIGGPVERIINMYKNPEKYTQEEIEETIRGQYRYFLNDNFLNDYNNREQILTIFTNANFLRSLIDVLKTVRLSPDEIICCNKVTYDYNCQKQPIPEIKDLLMELSHTINKSLVDNMSNILGRRNAEMLALLRRSSFKELTNVKRVNGFIVRNCDGITIQNLEYIFAYLYKETGFRWVFNGVMFDVINGSEFVNGGEVNRYRMIYEITMQILEQAIPTAGIRTILENYMSACSFNPGIKTRFNPDDLQRFPRIYNAWCTM